MMTSRSKDSYRSLFNHLKIHNSVYPHILVIDLDSNLKSALSEVYPNALTYIDFYSFKKSLYFKLKTMGVMSTEATAEKIPTILEALNLALFRTYTAKDTLIHQIDRMHSESGPEFDEFFESLKTFVVDNTDALKYGSVVMVYNSILEEIYLRIHKKIGSKPRLASFIQALREEEKHYKMIYESLKEKCDPKEFSNIKLEVQDPEFDFENQPDSTNNPRRKIFFIDTGDNEDDEIEERYYSDRSSD